VRSQRQQLARLEGAAALVCFIRSYWDDNGADVVMWWEGADGRCRHVVAVTGETSDAAAPVCVVSDEEVPRVAFRRLLAGVIERGGLAIADDREAFVFSNSDDVVRVKAHDGRENQWRMKTGAQHRDPRDGAVFELIRAAAPAYWPES
jgi:hypothetical protein